MPSMVLTSSLRAGTTGRSTCGLFCAAAGPAPQAKISSAHPSRVPRADFILFLRPAHSHLRCKKQAAIVYGEMRVVERQTNGVSAGDRPSTNAPKAAQL